MTYETIKLESDARGIATLTLNQPDKHNAMSATMIAELTDVVKELGQDKNVRAVVLTGEGKSFCAGGDLGWMKQQFEADRETRIAEAMKLATMLRDLNEMPKPLIGKIQGQAFGGGIGMMCVCDVAVGLDVAKFALTVSSCLLVYLVGARPSNLVSWQNRPRQKNWMKRSKQKSNHISQSHREPLERQSNWHAHLVRS